MSIHSIVATLLRRIKEFGRSESGLTLPLLAISLVTITSLVGIGIDLGRLQLVQSKLQFSLDAAALAAGSTISTANINTEVNKYLDTNFNGYLGATLTGTNVSTNANTTVFNLSATATLPSTFLEVVGISTLTATATSQITRVLPSLEVALVIDVSYGDNVTDFKAGLTNFINKLFAEAAGTLGNLYVGIVPFSHVVNIGTQHSAWLDPTYSAQLMTTYPAGWGPAGSPSSTWGGCVDARSNGFDVTDDPPQPGNPNTLFHQYYWYSDTYQPYPTLNPGGTLNAADSLISIQNKRQESLAQGTSDYNHYAQWTTVNGLQQTAALSNLTYGLNIWNDQALNVIPAAPSETYYASPLDSLHQGPNFMCPQAITPLTSNQTTLINAISAMNIQGDWIPNQGLIWGWNLLSPKWRGVWTDASMAGNNPQLPLDYNTPGNNKVVVWVEGIEVDTYGITTAIDNNIRSAYGYLNDNVLGTTDWNTANNTVLMNRTAQICASMKNQGIYVYVVGYSADNSYGGGGFGILAQCPTAANYGFFYGAGDWTGWDHGLDAIADSLVNLRVSH